jgi:P-type Ca2+ transporter type 2C
MSKAQAKYYSEKARTMLDTSTPTAGSDLTSSEIQTIDLTAEHVDNLESVIQTYASQSLRTIGLGYRDFNSWPPKGFFLDEDGEVSFEELIEKITLIAIVGIEDPLREGVRNAVAACIDAGVTVRMVTGDNVVTAKSIATQCGIFTDGLILEGAVFRNLSNKELDTKIPNLQVLARSSPEDKRILVAKLKELGEIVAVTGDGTNDGPALRTADVGFSMGIAGTEVAKEASSIILMDDDFSSIVKAIMWGRSVNDAVQKFLQFQLTVNISAVFLTFISAVSSEEEKAVLSPVQLLWVNLIMDTFAALALATDPPTPDLLKRKPTPKDAPLITVEMWKMLIGQSILQLTISLTLFYAGPSILDYETDELTTLIFNTFVFFQIFNEIK